MAMLETTRDLPDDPGQLKELVGILASEVKSQSILIEKLKHQLAGMRRHRFGVGSEALDRLLLSLEDEKVGRAAEGSIESLERHAPSEQQPNDRPRRKPLPDRLERHEEVLSPGEACGQCAVHRRHWART